jgi:hypothetical protein
VNRLETIAKDGFNFNARRGDDSDLAFISLKIALKAYFSTYQTFSTRLHIFDPSYKNEPGEIDSNHFNSYCEMCAECIVHFQHFAELVCKGLLRDDHPLLSDIALTNPKTLHLLLHGKTLTEEQKNAVRSIEFSEALKRISDLIDAGLLKDATTLKFFLNHKQTLEVLNSLRNKVWHRGLFILRYPALDQFIGGFVLPFVVDVLRIVKYQGKELSWKYTPLDSGIDPLVEIIKESSNANPDIGKLAFLKEMGRAAYQNPSAPFKPVPGKAQNLTKLFSQRIHARALRIAKVEADQEYASISICPVCGVKALISYDETDSIECETGDDGIEAWNYVYMVKCECCSFKLEGAGLKNAVEYGFSGIADFWRTRSL